MTHLLEVRDLVTEFRSDTGTLQVLDRVSFTVDRGEILGIAGESGCGKSVTGLTVMGLLPPSGKLVSGSVVFDGVELTGLTEKELDRIRGKDLTMVFQDALASLNPVFTVGSQMTETIRAHTSLRGDEAKARAEEMLRKAGIPDPPTAMKKYPHTLSGGMRQRVMIAMALCCGAKLVIADEPITALDVTVQAQIIKLLRDLRDSNGTAVVLVSHDLGLLAQSADRILVMYAGQVVESAPVRQLVMNPLHPYTKALMAAVPDISDSKDRVLESIPGSVPGDYGALTGCRFAARCPYATEACTAAQELTPAGADSHLVRCCRAPGKGDAPV